ncbi:GMC family oxidoreductase [Aspergillus clavatus NRRL 1]|uniref:Glucose-methanol-choline (Gmc) oxidoreductase n=1 Tax=Aspergillus clavatus (strain ATCC 1007 / CBS 513.65 / DSM 816 / NCTC 3887 / NRRL 1 / QM 1276 / 107) TaxID=344612 RepID=A1C9N2_ASPCL|nr:glucose-methanol-choline (gmc) oxidoreductase [Aspergillus clavatus NRRL 1]EAW13556.1 glucose-methanol-choline (gmc) oxidoreductase [Aspergillus clavatus NRRL 1]
MASEAYWDFVIVGGGPAGCALAATLARSSKRPQVLLLEAGPRNDDPALRVDGQRWATFLAKGVNWGYSTVPQEHCNNRQIDYSRGKVLGGTSAINFGLYTVGARDDYDEWASVVGDDLYRWDRMQQRFRNLETFDSAVVDPDHKKYISSRPSDHGSQGALHVGYAAEWERDLPLMMDVFEKAGFARNPDHNSGNPLGMALLINSFHQGRRVAATDLLEGAPENLTIITESPVQRVILSGKKAIGVESKGRQFYASKDVILTAGALDSPKILMHSGIGPSEQLGKFQIPLVHDLPAIGQNLRDHFFAPLSFKRSPETNDRNAFFGDKNAMDEAMTQWMKDGTGPWARYSCQLAAGWFKSDGLLASAEFQELPPTVQDFLKRETVPHYEFMTNFPVHFIRPQMTDYSYMCLLVFLMNEQSSGELRLQSSNPDDPLLFDPKFFSHPFDRRACIEILRDALQVTKHESFTKDTVAPILVPASESDEDLLAHWKNTLGSSWHMTGTVKMGKSGDVDAAVDSRFRVFGTENLRVADMSVVPVLTNNHTQATAYVTGLTCAEALIAEYELDCA